jgi:hypothetical protein
MKTLASLVLYLFDHVAVPMAVAAVAKSCRTHKDEGNVVRDLGGQEMGDGGMKEREHVFVDVQHYHPIRIPAILALAKAARLTLPGQGRPLLRVWCRELPQPDVDIVPASLSTQPHHAHALVSRSQ